MTWKHGKSGDTLRWVGGMLERFSETLSHLGENGGVVSASDLRSKRAREQVSAYCRAGRGCPQASDCTTHDQLFARLQRVRGLLSLFGRGQPELQMRRVLEQTGVVRADPVLHHEGTNCR